MSNTLKSQRGKGGGGIGPEETLVAETLREHPRPGSNSNGALVAHALTGEGHDASEDGTGRGVPLIANGLVKRYGKGTDSDATDTFVAAPLTKGSATGNGVNAPGRRQEDDVNIVAFHPTGGGAKGLSESEDVAPGTGTGTGGTVAIAAAVGVRRLTPTECERLQGLPDGWTQLGDTPDSRRYAALGDAVTATVAEWIGSRLMRASHPGPPSGERATKEVGRVVLP